MIVAVFVLFLHGAESFAAVVRDLHPHIHQIQAIKRMRTGIEFLVIMRTGAAGYSVGLFAPGGAAIAGFPHATFAPVQLNGGIQHVRVLRRDGQADLAQVALRQPLAELVPVFTTIGGFIECCVRATADIGGYSTMTLPGGGIKHVRVAWINDHVGHSGPDIVVFISDQRALPVVAAIAGFVQTALAALAPQRSLRRHPDGVGIVRMHNDLADVLGLFQTEILPAGTAVKAAINTITKANVATADILAGADPDDVRIGWINADGADGITVLTVENRLPGSAVVDGFPHPAGAHRHIPDAVVIRMNGDIGNSA